MKIRTNFVSNSSSTSFCIYGVELGYELMEKIKAKIMPKSLDDDDFDEFEMFRLFLKDEKIIKMEHLGGDSWYLGRDFKSIGDNETGRQFKNSTEERIRQLLDDPTVKCTSIEESSYDG